MADTAVELSTFGELQTFEPAMVDAYADRAYADAKSYDQFRLLVSGLKESASGGIDSLRAGIGLFILSRFNDALDQFSKSTDNKTRRYYAGRSALAVGRYADAISNFESAAKQGWDTFEIDMFIARAHHRGGDFAAAEAIAKKHARDGDDRADWYVVRGCLAESRGERIEAIDVYEKAITLDADHVEASFRAAWLYDMLGDDERAIDLYESLSLQPRSHVNALINLAVIYEDRGDFTAALNCLRRVLAAYPDHTRARLFFKDVESSREMMIEEAGSQRNESVDRLISTPISEFELSVRARNCLKKMRIQTLGDLLRLTEAELLTYKNFGETSLNEIKQLLARRGMRLGQRPEEIDPETITTPAPPPPPKIIVPPGSEALLGKPVSELELSVRSRRCLQRLNVSTIGDLLQKSEAELLATRNFGQTSLTEIKSRLAELGLTLPAKP